ncbi:MAG: sensor domain-containing diguanylate cyclase [Candidatus Omnitrophota bacterium]|nr:sensor domain-containing diguanylate cyclase [Candidatus Omnitrophota bacterium]
MYNFISLIALFFFIVTALIITSIGKLKFIFFLSAFFIFILLFLVFKKLRLNIAHSLYNELEKLEEKNNLLIESISEKKKILDTLPARSKKISSLFNVSCDFLELIEPDEIFDFIINTSTKLFPQADSVLLFLLEDGCLNLTRSVKQRDTVIKEKRGDIIEKWVLKHNQSLVVEDITKDFRFDYNKVLAFKERKIRSFIASPLAVGDVMLGTMRVESNNASHFLMDDSRLLRSICDLGAVVIERADLIRKAEELAIKDPLTSLFLRNYFLGRLKEEIRRASSKHTGIGLIMLDIDDFKKINDIHGHGVGDSVLKKLAQILSDLVGNSGDIICRFGGEEFMILLVECSPDRLISTAEKIRKTICETIVSFRRKEVHFTVSAGAVLYPNERPDVLEFIDSADKLLYKAKKEGKNKVCYTGC